MPTAQTLLIKKTKLKPGQILASVYLEVKNNEIFNENGKYPRSTEEIITKRQKKIEYVSPTIVWLKCIPNW
jgi:hypothetical protein